MNDEMTKTILALLDEHRIMTIATLRPDGWPQATTVGYVNEGLILYFLCGLDSQKAKNLARDDRISLTIDHDALRAAQKPVVLRRGRLSRPSLSRRAYSHR